MVERMGHINIEELSNNELGDIPQPWCDFQKELPQLYTVI
jgi:hypothetical protein